MANEPIRILALNLGSKYIGFAALAGGELRDWGVKVIPGRWSPEKAERARALVASLIDQYEPAILAMKRLNPSRSSSELRRFVARVRNLARRRGLKVRRYSLQELEDALSPERRVNRRQMAEIVALDYPFLLFELEREKSHKHGYHIRMFEAVALADVCFRQADNQYRRWTKLFERRPSTTTCQKRTRNGY